MGVRTACARAAGWPDAPSWRTTSTGPRTNRAVLSPPRSHCAAILREAARHSDSELAGTLTTTRRSSERSLGTLARTPQSRGRATSHTVVPTACGSAAASGALKHSVRTMESALRKRVLERNRAGESVLPLLPDDFSTGVLPRSELDLRPTNLLVDEHQIDLRQLSEKVRGVAD